MRHAGCLTWSAGSSLAILAHHLKPHAFPSGGRSGHGGRTPEAVLDRVQALRRLGAGGGGRSSPGGSSLP